MAGPPNDCRNAERAFRDLPFSSGERRCATVGPSVDLSTVVGGENYDRVVVETVVLKPTEHNADVVVHLLQCRFFQAKICLRSAHGVVLWRKVSQHMRALGSSR